MRNTPPLAGFAAVVLAIFLLCSCGRTAARASILVLDDECWKVEMVDGVIEIDTDAMTVSVLSTATTIEVVGPVPEPCKPICSVDFRIFVDGNGNGRWDDPADDPDADDEPKDHYSINWTSGATSHSATGLTAANVPAKDNLFFETIITFCDGTSIRREFQLS